MATCSEVRALLSTTTLPTDLVEDLLGGASAMWLMGESSAVIAEDLALCWPVLAPDEVRATIHPTAEPLVWRLSVVTHDRTGIVAQVASALSTHGLSVVRASGSVWPDRRLSVLRVLATGFADEDEWAGVATDLRSALAEKGVKAPVFDPMPPVKVAADPHTGGRTLVRVSAPDRVGLLWAVAAWLAEHGCNIEVARVGGDGTTVDDTFVVEGTVSASELATYLSGQAGEADALWVVRVARGWFSWLREHTPLG